MFFNKRRKEIEVAKDQGHIRGYSEGFKAAQEIIEKDYKKGYQHGQNDRETHYDQTVIPKMKEQMYDDLQKIRNLEKQNEELNKRLEDYKKYTKESIESLMKMDRKNLQNLRELNEYKDTLLRDNKILFAENKELFFKIKDKENKNIERLEKLQRKTKSFKKKKKIESRIQKLLMKGE